MHLSSRGAEAAFAEEFVVAVVLLSDLVARVGPQDVQNQAPDGSVGGVAAPEPRDGVGSR